MADGSVELQYAERAAKRWGRSNPSPDEVLQELVPDEQYQACPFARERYHRVMAQALDLAPVLAEMKKCPTCDGIVPNPKNKYCSYSCARRAPGGGKRGGAHNVRKFSASEIETAVEVYRKGRKLEDVRRVLRTGWATARRLLEDAGELEPRPSHECAHPACSEIVPKGSSRKYCSDDCQHRSGMCVDCGAKIKKEATRCVECYRANDGPRKNARAA